jgi:hypothetical protein
VTIRILKNFTFRILFIRHSSFKTLLILRQHHNSLWCAGKRYPFPLSRSGFANGKGKHPGTFLEHPDKSGCWPNRPLAMGNLTLSRDLSQKWQPGQINLWPSWDSFSDMKLHMVRRSTSLTMTLLRSPWSSHWAESKCVNYFSEKL